MSSLGPRATIAPTIPSEMTDQIIDHLHDDSTALRHCSLVCRAWIASSRCHLFYHVTMVVTKRAEAFARLLAYSPHIAQYVQELSIEEGQPPFSTLFVERIIPAMAPKLTNLKMLWLSRVFFNPTLLSTFSENFPLLRSLTLSSPTFKSFKNFTTLVTSHVHLSKLGVSSLAWLNDFEEDEIMPLTAATSRLRILKLFRSPTARIILWMQSSHYLTSGIEHLRVIATIREDIPTVSELLASLGPSLKRLEVGMPTFTVGGDQGTLTSISQNTSLRILHFLELVVYYQTRESTRAGCKWVADTLELVTSSNMEEILFSVRYEETEELGLLNLERIDSIFQKPSFNGLQRVIFVMNGPLDDQMDKEDIKRRMSGLTRRKLLVFQ